MDIEEALEFADQLVFAVNGKHLDSLQKEIFRGAWDSQKYKEIAQRNHRSDKYIKVVGCELWKILSDALGETMSKTTLRSTLERSKFLNNATNFARDFIGVGNVNVVCVETLNFSEGLPQKSSTTQFNDVSKVHEYLDEMPKSGIFYNRTQELANLEQWILQEHCQLVTIVGVVGIGKTALAIQLIEKIKDKFEYVIWLNLSASSALETIQTDLISFFSSQEETKLRTSKNRESTSLIYYFQKYRCLVIIDDLQMVFSSGELAGNTKIGYEGYNNLFRQITELSHKSCMLTLSREKSREIVTLESENKSICCLQLQGLGSESQEILRDQDLYEEENWFHLVSYYQGNPLWLKIISTMIRDLFSGKVSDLLQYEGAFLSEDLQYLLDQQFDRLSDTEKQVMYIIASETDAIPISKLLERMQLSPFDLFNAVQSLGRRSLIEKSIDKVNVFSLQPVIKQYVKNKYSHTLR